MEIAALSPYVRRSLAAVAVAGTLVLAGCDRLSPEDGEATSSSEPVALESRAADDTAAGPVASEPMPERIYFDLTRYDWYARGEPLVHSETRYEAGGDVVAAPLSAMRKVGDYQGVDVYGASDATDDSTLYVPVHPGYWLPFVRRGGSDANGG
jgi:hypothetical protein